MEHAIMIAGSGGQGTLFLGRLMAYASMLEEKEVTWFPSYGAEMRGGTANCTVIISTEMIGSPVIQNPQVLIVMNEASYKRFSDKVCPGGTLLYDASLVNISEHRSDISVVAVPASMLSATMNGTKMANMIMMGAFVSSTGILSLDSVVSALDDITPPGRKKTIDINKKFIAKGFEIIENKKGHHI